VLSALLIRGVSSQLPAVKESAAAHKVFVDRFRKIEQFGTYDANSKEATGTVIERRRNKLNPFRMARFSFEDVSEIFAVAAEQQDRANSDATCRARQRFLETLSVPGTGLVPIAAFYSNAVDQVFADQNLDWLRTTGALDRHNNVLVANYMQGPANCIQRSSILSVCCHSPCAAIHGELMELVQASFASSDVVLDAVSQIAWRTFEEEGNITAAHAAKLQVVADRHHGSVPLHSRLFSAWLHYTFPNHCPYHHAADEGIAYAWVPKGPSAAASSRERDQALQKLTKNVSAEPQSEPHWDDRADDVLALLEPRTEDGRGVFGQLLRVLVPLALLAAMARTLVLEDRSALRCYSPNAWRNIKEEKKVFV